MRILTICRHAGPWAVAKEEQTYRHSQEHSSRSASGIEKAEEALSATSRWLSQHSRVASGVHVQTPKCMARQTDRLAGRKGVLARWLAFGSLRKSCAIISAAHVMWQPLCSNQAFCCLINQWSGELILGWGTRNGCIIWSAFGHSQRPILFCYQSINRAS